MGVFSRTLLSTASYLTTATTTSLTIILLFIAVSILSLSPSASAERCTPTFILEDDDASDYADTSMDQENKVNVIVREGAEFKMICNLNNFNSIKWTINGREINSQLQDEWGVEIVTPTSSTTQNGSQYSQYTELTVYNATKFHNGEFKCTSVCSAGDEIGANVGVKVTVSIAIAVTVNGVSSTQDSSGNTIHRKLVGKDKSTDLVCSVKVSNAKLQWLRINDERKEEDMAVVCAKKPELAEGEEEPRRRPPPHCSLTATGSTLKLHFYRVRKDRNDTLHVQSDFRRYYCRAKSEGNQDGSAILDLAETVSASRFFGKGSRSVTVVQGDKLEIYCDINGIKQDEITSGTTKIAWLKDGKKLDVELKQGLTKLQEKDKPFRQGFIYEMAEPEHRGYYTCLLKQGGKDADSSKENDTDKEIEFTYYVRVKDKLGALWPFLAICGEVVILCTIILIYEQRRNKAELDESDTDGSPDQKNSNDDGDSASEAPK